MACSYLTAHAVTLQTLTRRTDIPKGAIEKVCALYGLIDQCRQCDLGKDEKWNHPPRLRFKFGRQTILLVGQNPGLRAVPGCNHIWGGLDLLQKRKLNKRTQERLDKVLEAVWITNIVKCRKEAKGKNGTLHATEIEECLHWLENEIEYIRPTRIVALGKPADRWLSHIGKKHSSIHHPSYVLRGQEPDEDYVNRLYEQVFGASRAPRNGS
ncbi:MAG: uracil-DNA glycosylase family protein [Methanotrichaceae archaeon]|nr:uracil-DNA glycosylase family protein [Methanotrichaceae archaeon]